MKIKVDTLELKSVLNKIDKLKLCDTDLISIKVDGFKHAEFKACNYISRLQMSITVLKVETIEDGATLIPYYLIKMLAQQNAKAVTISDEELSWDNGNIKILQEQQNDNFKTLNIKDGDELFFIYEEELYRLLNNVASSSGIDVKSPITLTPELTKILLRTLDKKSKRIVHFALDNTCKYLKIRIGFEVIIAKLLEDEYIKYESIIPKDFNYSFTIENPKEFLNKLKSMYGLSSCYRKLLRIKLTDGCLQIQDKSQMAIINNSVKIENVKSNKVIPFEIAVNPYYLYKPLNKYEGAITVKFTNSVSPIVITDEDKNLDLILPVRMGMEEGNKHE